MPPKPKYKKEEIVSAAYELVREKGIDAMVAREVGKRLNTSATPIFTVWNSMEELKDEVRELAKQKFLGFMEGIFDYTPVFKEFGMRWVQFAADEPNLYHMLFLGNNEVSNPYLKLKSDYTALMSQMVPEVSDEFGLTEEEAVEIINQMAVFANGLAAMITADKSFYDPDAVSHSLSQVCLGMVIAFRINRNSLTLEEAKAFAELAATGSVPTKLAKTEK